MTNRKRVVFTTDEKNTIIKMRKSGFGYATIAKEIGRSKGAVGQFCRSNDLGGVRTEHRKDVKSLKETHPEIVKMMKYPQRANKITYGSFREEVFVCQDCGLEIKKRVSSVTSSGFRCPRCSDSISYPEKFMFNVLYKLGIEFEHEKTFEWGKNKRYDFYIPSYSAIIETHGIQHYQGTGFESIGGRTLEEEQENDRLKEQLAKENGIKNYIIIDCRKSELDWIKKKIIDSQMSLLFDLSGIEWENCHHLACNSLVRVVSQMWTKDSLNIKAIADRLRIDTRTVSRYLLQGAELGWCDYKKRNWTKPKEIAQITMSGKLVRFWKNANAVHKDLGIDGSGILASCKGDSLTYKDFIWLYKDDFLSSNNAKDRVARANQLKGTSKVVKLTLEGHLLDTYNSVSDAATFNDLNPGNIHATCNGRRATTGGYRWSWYSDYKQDETTSLPCNRLKTGLKKKVYQLTLDGQLITKWNSVSEASVETGISKSSISSACSGRYSHAGGYKWMFVDESSPTKRGELVLI